MKKPISNKNKTANDSDSQKMTYSKSHYLNMLKIICVAILFYIIVSKLVTVSIISVFSFILSVLSPILLGLAIAFILNLPLKFFETKVFGKLTANAKTVEPAHSGISLVKRTKKLERESFVL